MTLRAALLLALLATLGLCASDPCLGDDSIFVQLPSDWTPPQIVVVSPGAPPSCPAGCAPVACTSADPSGALCCDCATPSSPSASSLPAASVSSSSSQPPSPVVSASASAAPASPSASAASLTPSLSFGASSSPPPSGSSQPSSSPSAASSSSSSSAASSSSAPSPSAPVSPGASSSATGSGSATPSGTAAASVSASPTASVSPTATASASAAASVSASSGPSVSLSATSSLTLGVSASGTPTMTSSPSQTPSSSQTPSASLPAPSLSSTGTGTPSASLPAPSPSGTGTGTPSASLPAPSPSGTGTGTPSASLPAPSPSNSATRTPSASPPAPSPSNSATRTPSSSAIPASATPSLTPSRTLGSLSMSRSPIVISPSSSPTRAVAGTTFSAAPTRAPSAWYPLCPAAGGAAPVQAPTLMVYERYGGGTYWFSSPLVLDLDENGSQNEIVACYYSCKVFRLNGAKTGLVTLQTISYPQRSYTPHAIVKLRPGAPYSLCVGYSTKAVCTPWNSATASFPVADANTGTTQGFEIRGMSVGDIDNDGYMDVCVSTTSDASNTWCWDGGRNMTLKAGWPRDNLAGVTLPADNEKTSRNCVGNNDYGQYGLNLGMGNVDDDPALEILTSYDNHHQNVYDGNGIMINCAPSQKNIASGCKGGPLTYGQLTKVFTNYTTHKQFYEVASGNPICYPVVISQNTITPCGAYTPCDVNARDEWDPAATPSYWVGGDAWLQWTASPVSAVDIDLDGHREIITVPNVERDGQVADLLSCGYRTMYYAMYVIGGAWGQANTPNATNLPEACVRRFKGPMLPRGDLVVCYYDQQNPTATCNPNGYPPGSPTSVAFADLLGDRRLEMVVHMRDGKMHCFDSNSVELWAFSFAAFLGIDPQAQALEASEATIADLNADGVPEIVFTVYGLPSSNQTLINNQGLFILTNTGQPLHFVATNTFAFNGNEAANGNGAGSAGGASIADVDGDGQLELLFHDFNSRFWIFTVPGSKTNCLPWPYRRGGFARRGQADADL